jgi:peptidyl-tRNA hydrolase, PTH1 family
MKLIVGLGNPGKEYQFTRHNVGFLVLDSYLGNVKWQKKFKAQYYVTKIDNQDVCFIKPETMMNNSGDSVILYKNYYKINIEDILVIQDDMDMAFKTYKIKKNSSSGGHNGIKSIINNLNSEEFARLKIGILDDTKKDAIDFVLGRFSKEEYEYLINNEDFKNVINLFIKYGIDKTIEMYKR